MTAVVGLGWFMAFLRAMSPSVGGEDSGEFAAAAATLGIGHAPGYPLHALVGRLMMTLPIGDLAFRLNMLSAASAAAACAALFHLVRREGHTRGAGGFRALLAGLLASGAFGLTRALWHQATISDKYAFHLMLSALICVAAARRWRPAVIGLLIGIAFSHHLQTLYLIPGLAWLGWRQQHSTRTWVLIMMFVVVGLSPKLLYPPVRAVRDPVLLLAHPATIGRSLNYLRGGTSAHKIAGPAAGTRWKDTLKRLGIETTLAGIATGAAGLLLMRTSSIGPLCGFTIAAGLLLTASLEITGREFYLLPVVWWLAAGTGGLVAASSGRWRALAMAFSLVSAIAPGIANRYWFDRTRMTLERDFGMNILNGLPPHTVLFASGDDILYPVFYLQSVQSVRPDVVVIPEGYLSWPVSRDRIAGSIPETTRLLSSPPGTDTEEGWSRGVAVSCLAANRPLAMTNPSREGVAKGLHRAVRDLVWEIYSLRSSFPDRPPRGLIVRGWHAHASSLTDRQRWLIGLYARYQRQSADRLANAGRPLPSLPHFRLAMINPYLSDRPGAGNNFALALEHAGDRSGALQAFRSALLDPAAAAEVWLNAGNLLQALGRKGEAARMYQSGLARANPGSVHAAYAARQLEQLKIQGVGGP